MFNKKKFVAVSLALTLISTMFVVPVYAEDDLFGESQTGLPIDNVPASDDFNAWSDLGSLVQTGDLIMPSPFGTNDWSGAFLAATQLQTSMSQNLSSQFEVAWNNVGGAVVADFASLNTEYAFLQLELSMAGYGQGSVQNPGYSKETMNAYIEAFGDTGRTPTFAIPAIPDNFNPSATIANARVERAALLGDFRSSDAFNSVVSNVGFSNAFAQASQTKSMPGLLSGSAMSATLAEGDATASALRGSAHSSNQAEMDLLYAGAKTGNEANILANNNQAVEKYTECVNNVTDMYQSYEIATSLPDRQPTEGASMAETFLMRNDYVKSMLKAAEKKQKAKESESNGD